MKFTEEELECFQQVIDNLESTHASILLKVLYYYVKNASTTIRFQLQPSVLERLEQRDYDEYDPIVYEDLRKCWRIIAEIVQEKEIIDNEHDDDFDDGIYAVPSPKCLPKYNFREVFRYKRENGIDELINADLNKFRITPKGFICRSVEKVEDATHWLPAFCNHRQCDVTPYELYRVFHDRYEDEYLIQDNNDQFSLIYLWHVGRFVVLEETWKPGPTASFE